MATITSTDETYKKLISENKLVLVDFWAPWCSPCKTLTPVLESISENYKELKVIKHNIDDFPNVATIENIRSILLTGNHASEDDLKLIDKEIKKIVNESAEFAKASPEPDHNELYTDIYA